MAIIIDPDNPPIKGGGTIGSWLIRKESFKQEVNSNRIFDRDQIEWYDKFNRFGLLDPYNALSGSKEYLFFTKPDLHLMETNGNLNPELETDPFFKDLYERYRKVMYQLQLSADPTKTPFMPILSNAVKSTLDLPEISGKEVDGPATIYGTNIKYRGSSYASDEEHEFSLEFEDTRYLEVYMLIKTWDMYYRRRMYGTITPVRNDYTIWKTLDDQIAVYKFIVAEDGETIVHFSKLYGCYPLNVPRNVFSDGNKADGVNFTVSWRAQFVDDMDPLILRDFNTLVNPLLSSYTRTIPIYDSKTKAVSSEWASLPFIYKSGVESLDGFSKYKLKWRGRPTTTLSSTWSWD